MDKRAEELAALHAKLESGIPGYELPPNKPPQGLIVDRNCDKCAGTGWLLSELYGTFLICPCTLGRREYTPSTPYKD